MANFKYDFFQGIRPRLSARLLGHPQAQTMENVRLGSGAMEPWNKSLNEKDLTSDLNTIETIYRFRQGGLLRNRVWFEFADDVDVARGPLLDDPLERTYYTGAAQAEPRMTYTTLVTASGLQPNNYRILGIPAPSTAATLVGDSIPSIGLTGSVTGALDANGATDGILTTILKADFHYNDPAQVNLYLMDSWHFGFNEGYDPNPGPDHTFDFDAQVGMELKVTAVVDADTVTVSSATGGGVIFTYTDAQSHSAPPESTGFNSMRDSDGNAKEGHFRFSLPNGVNLKTVSAHNLLVDDVIRITGIPDPLRFTIGRGKYKTGTTIPCGGGEFYGGESDAPGCGGGLDVDVATWPANASVVAEDDFYGRIGQFANANVEVYWTLDGAAGTVFWPIEGSFDWQITERGGVPYNEIVTDIESRVYVYTWVSELGEEGPPSPPSAALSIPSDGSVTVTMTNNPPTTQRNITDVRIYRANTGTASSEFQFVAEVAIGTLPTYVDTILDVNLGEVLQSASWDPPDVNMEGITALSTTPRLNLITIRPFTLLTIPVAIASKPHNINDQNINFLALFLSA